MTERLRFIDVLKGLAILTVVFGHCLTDIQSSGTYPEFAPLVDAMKAFVYSFHMPLFFMASGFVFYLTRSYERWQPKVLNLILLFVIWCTVTWFFKSCFSGDVNHPMTLHDLIAYIINPTKSMVYWYLYVLAILYMVWSLLRLTNVTIPLCVTLAAIALGATQVNCAFAMLQPTAYHAFFFVVGGGIPV